jgi:crotonobetainyl-CoA:carnitine CoA-transferase CaiB-like acyl-CoA transferase
MGILGALHRRSVTGEGERVEVTMVQAGLDLQTEPLLYHLNGAVVERPSVPLASAFHEAPYGFYPVSDGYVALSLSPLRTISAALGNPSELDPYLDPADALVRREEIYTALRPLLRDFSVAALLELFRSHGIWCAPVNDYDAVVHDPAVQYLEPIEQIDHPVAGQVSLLRHPVRYGSGAATARRLPPALGQDTDDVLAEAGYDTDRVRALQAVGAVGAATTPTDPHHPVSSSQEA